jgi:hypothetical protein
VGPSNKKAHNIGQFHGLKPVLSTPIHSGVGTDSPKIRATKKAASKAAFRRLNKNPRYQRE